MGKRLKIAGLKFDCDNNVEAWRVGTLFTKEPGTIAWLDEEIKDGDVLYDIGANIGLYSIYAASKGAKVYAFEPHIINAAKLILNTSLNHFTYPIDIITSPLHDTEDLIHFYYQHLEPGTSGSQLGHMKLEKGGEFKPVFTETKHSLRLDSIALMHNPNLMKIDVDGNELYVLEGAREHLQSGPLRSIQVEMHQDNAKRIEEYLLKFNFKLYSIHHTSFGQEAIDKGADVDKVFYNAIFYKI